MARGRFISKETAIDKKIDGLSSDTCRFAWVLLITQADVEGNVFGDAAVLRSLLFPRRADVTIEMMAEYIAEWQAAGFVTAYRGDDGDDYLHLCNFEKHQVGLRKEREETIHPSYTGSMPEESWKDAGKMPEQSRNKAAENPAEEKEEEEDKLREREEEEEVENGKFGGGIPPSVGDEVVTLIDTWDMLGGKLPREEPRSMHQVIKVFERMAANQVDSALLQEAWQWYRGKHGFEPPDPEKLVRPTQVALANRRKRGPTGNGNGRRSGEFDEFIQH